MNYLNHFRLRIGVLGTTNMASSHPPRHVMSPRTHAWQWHSDNQGGGGGAHCRGPGDEQRRSQHQLQPLAVSASGVHLQRRQGQSHRAPYPPLFLFNWLFPFPVSSSSSLFIADMTHRSFCHVSLSLPLSRREGDHFSSTVFLPLLRFLSLIVEL